MLSRCWMGGGRDSGVRYPCCFGDVWRFANPPTEEPRARRRAKRGREQESMPACTGVLLQQMCEQPFHVGIRRMDFVDDEQAAHQTCGTKMRVLDLDRSQESLVNRAN